MAGGGARRSLHRGTYAMRTRGGHRGNSHRLGFGVQWMPCVARSCATSRSSGTRKTAAFLLAGASSARLSAWTLGVHHLRRL